MKLLFDKNNIGDMELKQLLSFLDANLKFSDLRSSIIAATNDVIALIGQATYTTAVTAYEKATPTDDDKDLFHAIRYPIIVQAYRQFIPTYDLRHTTSGRKNESEEHQKAPFEWQLDRDNKAQERRYYRALDDMIVYLDNKSPIWKASETYKSTFNLFIRDTKDFDDYFPIGNSRLLLIKLVPGIRQAQRQDIKPRISTELHDNMIKALRGETVPDFILNEDLLEIIKEALVYKAMAWALPRMSVQLFPEGTLQAIQSDRMKTPEKSEIPAVAQLFKADADRVYKEIEAMITTETEPIDPTDIEPLQPYTDEYDQFITT